jgi:hypothetical protein
MPKTEKVTITSIGQLTAPEKDQLFKMIKEADTIKGQIELYTGSLDDVLTRIQDELNVSKALARQVLSGYRDREAHEKKVEKIEFVSDVIDALDE